jgi:hypothetical protein
MYWYILLVVSQSSEVCLSNHDEITITLVIMLALIVMIVMMV